MNDKTKKTSNLGFRPPRVTEEVQAEITKQETTRLNLEITKELATKLKMQALKEDKTLKDLITPALEAIIK